MASAVNATEIIENLFISIFVGFFCVHQNDSFRKRCMSTQVDLDVLRFINQELLSDNEKIKELVSSSDQCIAEVSKGVQLFRSQFMTIAEVLWFQSITIA